MAETTTDGQSAGDNFDLSQFYPIFFEEAGENLDQMEQMLLALDLTQADDEELNAIFRCAHSIKGGAATFGFADVAELTHQMESLLDKLRRHELQPSAPMVDVLLESSDALCLLLARHQGKRVEAPATAELVNRISALAHGTAEAPIAIAPAAPAADIANTVPLAAPTPALPAGTRQLELHIGPLENPAQADGVAELFRDIPGLGKIEPLPCDQSDKRVYRVETTASDADLLDLFTFHLSKEQIHIVDTAATLTPQDTPAPAIAPSSAAASPVAPADFGFFDDAPGLPVLHAISGAAHAEEAPKAAARASGAAPAGSAMESSTLRVSVSKVDQLINLVGELVITQAMLAQKSSELDSAANQPLLAGLADLDRNTRDLQEAVMSIRMIPMSVVFNRFPRMLRDLASKLGKKVELVTHGESTELDKGLIEKITDPLTHLIRNSADHGIESLEERRAKGKTEHGTITLSASHQGGSILIEVRDDGKGLSRAKLLKKAREKGMDAPDTLSDAEVWGLIMAPGFSTAEVVTDVSGRGVGMDVVKKNIASLGGTVEIDSAEGCGMRVSVRLPLTLAIMDGMTVRVSDEVYILPLASVIESFQIKPKEISTVAQGARLVKVRDEYMPVIDLEHLFQVPRFEFNATSPIMVVIEADGARVALMVDELIGQQQVVIKNLESNYRKVPNVSGATILGDGKVALILDTSSLVRRSRH
ncbi:MAG: two-component system chemotaxis sensor kinase CheA [Hydrogenophaga sp.]|jgi:two-component system chemotaxis sensor kinase CheA